jgi:hypothetical protein
MEQIIANITKALDIPRLQRGATMLSSENFYLSNCVPFIVRFVVMRFSRVYILFIFFCNCQVIVTLFIFISSSFQSVYANPLHSCGRKFCWTSCIFGTKEKSATCPCCLLRLVPDG